MIFSEASLVTVDNSNENIEPTDHQSGFHAERTRRLSAIDDLRNTGVNPYPYRFDRTHTLNELREKFASLEAGNETDETVSVAGRIMLKRDQGKLIFVTIRDRSADIQLFISKSVVGDVQFDVINNLDLGDWVGAHGLIMTTRKGELSVKVSSVDLLSKALRPLPDKFHGLTDIDTRYRQRYADLIVNDEARRVFEVRHATISSFRRTLSEREYIEVETPVLHIEAGGAHARPFVTHHNTLDMQLFLRIALEL
ncbi:MAG: lysine--tRNA ligase, partial [Acidimicrobiaceae bacterium]|nr:lysine--tRNA ligase [Acidimicrobiaceae bacterium]